MEEYRKKINEVDFAIIKLLAKRRELSKEIVRLKSQNGVRDKNRENELISKLIKLGEKEGLNAKFVTKIFKEIIDDSVNLQSEILRSKKE